MLDSSLAVEVPVSHKAQRIFPELKSHPAIPCLEPRRPPPLYSGSPRLWPPTAVAPGLPPTTSGTHLPQGVAPAFPRFPALAHPGLVEGLPRAGERSVEAGPSCSHTQPQLPAARPLKVFPTHTSSPRLAWGGGVGLLRPTRRATEAPPSHEDTAVPSGRRRDPPTQDCSLVLKRSSLEVLPLGVAGLKSVARPRLLSGGGWDGDRPPPSLGGAPCPLHLLYLLHSVHLLSFRKNSQNRK